MDLKTFVNKYKSFLYDCEQNNWKVEILIEEFGNHLAAIKNQEGIEVQFFIEVDFQNYEKVSEKTHQSKLNYGVIRKEGIADIFAKKVMETFYQQLASPSSKQKSKILYYVPKK